MPTNRHRRTLQPIQGERSPRILAILQCGVDFYFLSDEEPTRATVRAAWDELRPTFEADTPAADVLGHVDFNTEPDLRMDQTFGWHVFELDRTYTDWLSSRNTTPDLPTRPAENPKWL